MVSGRAAELLSVVTTWLNSEPNVVSAVLFGSHARPPGAVAAADQWSDIDLHLIVTAPERFRQLEWASAFPGFTCCLHVFRPASAGTEKLILFFAEGEIEMVLVPEKSARYAADALQHQRHVDDVPLMGALTTMATIIGGGYRFVKGEDRWGSFYAAVSQMSGFRVENALAREMADAFLCDFVSVIQKSRRGELVAAQRLLHRSLVETNVTLVHEVRLRQGKITFQQARRVEQLLSPSELELIRVSLELNDAAITRAAWKLFNGLKALMAEIDPSWLAWRNIEALLRSRSGAA